MSKIQLLRFNLKPLFIFVLLFALWGCSSNTLDTGGINSNPQRKLIDYGHRVLEKSNVRITLFEKEYEKLLWGYQPVQEFETTCRISIDNFKDYETVSVTFGNMWGKDIYYVELDGREDVCKIDRKLVTINHVRKSGCASYPNKWRKKRTADEFYIGEVCGKEPSNGIRLKANGEAIICRSILRSSYDYRESECMSLAQNGELKEVFRLHIDLDDTKNNYKKGVAFNFQHAEPIFYFYKKNKLIRPESELLNESDEQQAKQYQIRNNKRIHFINMIRKKKSELSDLKLRKKTLEFLQRRGSKSTSVEELSELAKEIDKMEKSIDEIWRKKKEWLAKHDEHRLLPVKEKVSEYRALALNKKEFFEEFKSCVINTGYDWQKIETWPKFPAHCF
jgi:hypothetical protein